MELYLNKDVSIMCPYCKKFLTKADKRDPRWHKVKCKNCGKWIWFIPKTGEHKIKSVPKRTTSGGATYY